MASPPVGSGSSTGHSPLTRMEGSMRVHSQSPPPPKAVTNQLQQNLSHTPQAQLSARDHRHHHQLQQHQSGTPMGHTPSSPAIDCRHRNLSPRQQPASPILSTSPSKLGRSKSIRQSSDLSNCPAVVMQGNTQISHHPASPFAPILRTAAIAGVVRTASPTLRPHSHAEVIAPTASHLPHHQHFQPTAAVSSSSPPPSSSQSTEYQRVFCNSGAGPEPRPVPDDVSGSESNSSVHPASISGGHPRSSRRRKDLVATYEEAWDVKMSRRLGGMDVSRLAEALPDGGHGADKFSRHDIARASDRPNRSHPMVSAGVFRSPSLSPVLTSTEGIVMRPRATPRVVNYRNSSNETMCNREMMASPFRLRQNRVAGSTTNMSVSPRPGGPASPTQAETPVTDYDYAYNRSWSMGVQVINYLIN